MKKIFFIVLGLVTLTSLFAEVKFYGKVRTGAWYNYETNEEVLSLESAIYKATRLGANFKGEDFRSKVEIGITNNNKVFLRLAYGEYNFGKVKLLFGQDFTGFTSTNYSAQAALLGGTADLANVGIGAFFDSRIPMIKLSLENGLFLSLMQPVKVNPANLESDSSIDALLPKMNLGFNYKNDSFYVYPTIGINYCSYNKDRNNAKLDNGVMALAFATTVSYHRDGFAIKGQINYGKNASDYGIKGLSNASAKWDANKNEVIDSKTIGGFAQVKFNIGKKTDIIVGGGYSASDNDTLQDPDAAMDIFGQMNFKLSKNFMITPEVGYVDYMEDGTGKEEGTIIYFGSRLQANF